MSATQRYPFLTPDNYQALIDGLHRASREIGLWMDTPRGKGSSRKNKSKMVRLSLEECLREAFQGRVSVVVDYMNNAFVIVFEGKYFMFLRKSDEPDHYLSDPKGLHDFQVRFYDEEIPTQNPFPQLEHLFGMKITDVFLVPSVYICDDENKLAGLYINQQEEGVVIDSESIPMPSSIVDYPTTQEDDEDDEEGLNFDFKDDDNDPSEGDQGSRASGSGSAG